MKMNVGEGEKFTVVSMGMTLQGWWRFPWKPESRCSINHPGLYVSSMELPKLRGHGEGGERVEVPPNSLTLSPGHLKNLPGEDFHLSISLFFEFPLYGSHGHHDSYCLI